MISNYNRKSRSFQRSLTQTRYASGMSSYYGREARGQAGKYTEASSPKHRFRAILVIALILLCGAHLVLAKHASAESVAAHQAQVKAAALAVEQQNQFAGQVNALIDANPSVTFSVAIASSQTGLHQYGSTSAFDGASTAKLLTAADYLTHVQSGTATLRQSIDGHSAEYWLRIMLVNSDDTAWAALNDYLTHDDLQRYASRIGFTNYDSSDNTFTATDVASLLQKLYNGTLLNPANRSLVLGYLQQANYRDYIVAAVPANDTTYHKVGIDGDTVNDGAIIAQGKQYMVLVIFSDGHGTYDWPARAQLMHTITHDALANYL